MEEQERTYCVYAHINKTNGKMYIGYTKHGDNPNARWRDGNAYVNHRVFGAAIAKYTWDGFDHQIIMSNLTLEEAKKFEVLLIAKYKTNCFIYKNPSYGYNMTNGGDGVSGSEITKETREKLSKASKEQWEDPDYKKKMCEMRQGEGNGFYGTGEPVVQLTMDGEFIAEYVSASEAGKLNGFWEGAIRASCNNGLGHPYGFLWLYKKNYDPNVKYTPQNILLKAVVQLTKDGVFVAEYESVAEASRVTDIWAQSISNCCNGDMTSTGGYMWVYKSKYNPSIEYKWINHVITAVIQLTLDGEFIAQYNSLKEASAATGVHSTGVGHCCRGKHKTAGGFRWMYLEDYEKTTKQNDLKK